MARPLLGVVILLAALVASAGQERGGATAVVCFDKPDRMKWLKPKDCIEDRLKQKVCRIPTKLTEACPKEEYERRVNGKRECGTDGKPYYIQRLEVIDYYEANMGRGQSGTPPKLIEIGQHETNDEYLGRLVQRMDKYISPLGTILAYGQSYVNSRTILSAPAGLPPVLDIGVAPLPDPEKCVFSNMIEQSDYGPNLQVIQDLRLMKHQMHSRMSEVMAWGHEMVYSYLRTFKGHRTSVGARKAMLFLVTQYPVYTVQEVSESMLSLGVLPMLSPRLSDGFLEDGRRDDNVSTFDEEVAQLMPHFLDVLEAEYSPVAPLDSTISSAIQKFWPAFTQMKGYTEELLLYTREHLYNTLVTHYDPPAMTVQFTNEHKWGYELTSAARRKLTMEFFRRYYPNNRIKIL